MNIYYDPKADALDIVVKKGKSFETREIGNGMFLDVDKNGEPLSLEILEAGSRFAADDFSNLSLNIANYPSNFGVPKAIIA